MIQIDLINHSPSLITISYLFFVRIVGSRRVGSSRAWICGAESASSCGARIRRAGSRRARSPRSYVAGSRCAGIFSARLRQAGVLGFVELESLVGIVVHDIVLCVVDLDCRLDVVAKGRCRRSSSAWSLGTGWHRLSSPFAVVELEEFVFGRLCRGRGVRTGVVRPRRGRGVRALGSCRARNRRAGSLGVVVPGVRGVRGIDIKSVGVRGVLSQVCGHARHRRQVCGPESVGVIRGGAVESVGASLWACEVFCRIPRRESVGVQGVGVDSVGGRCVVVDSVSGRGVVVDSVGVRGVAVESVGLSLWACEVFC